MPQFCQFFFLFRRSGVIGKVKVSKPSSLPIKKSTTCFSLKLLLSPISLLLGYFFIPFFLPVLTVISRFSFSTLKRATRDGLQTFLSSSGVRRRRGKTSPRPLLRERERERWERGRERDGRERERWERGRERARERERNKF